MHFEACTQWEERYRNLIYQLFEMSNTEHKYSPAITEDSVATKCKCFARLETELRAEWIRHDPDTELMRFFHQNQIGKGMGVNSIFWTCSNCGGYGTLSYKYCSQCGAKMSYKGKEK